MSNPELGLGTAALATAYGSRRLSRAPARKTSIALLEHAVAAGIFFIDTAPSYGRSLVYLAEMLTRHPDWKVRIATKIPACSREIWTNCSSYRTYIEEYLEQFERSHLPKPFLLQFHDPNSEFLLSEAASIGAKIIRQSGIAEQIGVSLYDLKAIEEIVRNIASQWIQFPIHLLTSISNIATLRRIHQELRVNIIARSVFLQGVLFSRGPLPEVPAKNTLAALRAEIWGALPDTIESSALRFVRINCSDFVRVVLLGAATVKELDHSLKLWKRSLIPLEKSSVDKLQEIAKRYERHLDPRSWIDIQPT